VLRRVFARPQARILCGKARPQSSKAYDFTGLARSGVIQGSAILGLDHQPIESERRGQSVSQLGVWARADKGVHSRRKKEDA